MCFRDSYLAIFCSQLATHHCEENIAIAIASYIQLHIPVEPYSNMYSYILSCNLEMEIINYVTSQLVTMFLHMLHKSSSRSHAHFMLREYLQIKLIYVIQYLATIVQEVTKKQLASLYSLAALLRIISLGSQLVKDWGIVISQEVDLHILASWAVSQLQVFEACAVISVW